MPALGTRRARRRAAGRRRRWPRVALVAGAVLVLAAGWLAVRGYQIRQHLTAAQSALGSINTTDLRPLDQTAAHARADVAAARSAAGDPLWRLAAAVPVAGRSFAVARDATAAASTLVDQALPPGLKALQDLKSRPLLSAGTVDVARLRALQPEVRAASAAADRAAAQAAATPGTLLPGPVARLRRQLVDRTGQLAQTLTAARTAVDLAPAMLGADGPRRYFLAVQNNAETRGTGGLVGAYAVLRADGGKITRERVGTNQDFRNPTAPVVDLGREFSARYDSQGVRQYWLSSNLTPDWPSAAAIMAGLWQAQGGGKIDGVLGIDPVAMADVLTATGPAQVGPRTIDAGNVVDFVMRDEYAEFNVMSDENAQRKAVLALLAGALYDKLAAGGTSSSALLQALSRAGGSGHLQLWSAVPAEQQRIAPLRVSGALPRDPGAYLQVVMNNAAGNKADYYVRRTVDYRRNPDGTAQVGVTLSNAVDPAAVPPVVTLRADKPRTPVRPGATRFILTLVVGVGQQVRSVEVDGKPVPGEYGPEQGHGTATVQVEVAPGAPTVVTAQVTDPGGLLVYRQQPLVADDTLKLAVPWRRG